MKLAMDLLEPAGTGPASSSWSVMFQPLPSIMQGHSRASRSSFEAGGPDVYIGCGRAPPGNASIFFPGA